MKLNPLEQLLSKSSNEELDEIIEVLVSHIIDWLEEKPCPVCEDWLEEYTKHCPFCDGTGKIYIDYSHLYNKGEM